MPWEEYLENVIDTNMRIFMGQAKDEDKHVHGIRNPKPRVRQPNALSADKANAVWEGWKEGANYADNNNILLVYN